MLYEALQVTQFVFVQYILYLLVDEVVIEEDLIVVLKHTQTQCNLISLAYIINMGAHLSDISMRCFCTHPINPSIIE